MQSERILNTKRNIIMGFTTRLVNLLFPFVINTIVISTLGVEYLGLGSLFASILQVLSLAELGVGAALVFSMYAPIANGDREKVCALLNLYRRVYLLIGSAILVLGLAALPFIPKLIKSDVPDGINVYILFIFSLVNTSVSYFLFSYRTALFQATQRTDINDLIALSVNILLNVAKILVLIFTCNYYLFSVLVPVFTVINNLAVAFVTNRKYPEYKCRGSLDAEEKREILSRVSGLFVNKVCDVVCNSFDSIIISAFLGLELLGKYNNYFYIMNALMTLLGIVITAAVPSMGNSVAKESQEKNFSDFSALQLGFIWLTGWASATMLCLFQPFMTVWGKWAGKDMMLDMSVPILLTVYLYSFKSAEVFMSYRQACGIWAHDKVRPVFEALLNLVLNIVFVKLWGLPGVIVSTILTLGIIRMVWGSYYLFHEYFTEYSHGRYLLKMLYFAAVTFAACLLTFFVCELVPVEGMMIIPVRAVICIVIPNLLFLIAYSGMKEFKNMLGIIKGVLRIR